MANTSRVGVYICHCGINIAASVDVEAVARYASHLPGVVIARNYTYMCSDPGQAMIKDDIARLDLNRIVVASCSPLMHEPTFRACIADAGLNPYCLEMANIREQCAWVHKAGEDTTQKAMRLVASAVSKARQLEPLQLRQVPVTPAALVVGAGVAGIQSALDFADAGFHTTLIERDPVIGGHFAQWKCTFPTEQPAKEIVSPLIEEVTHHPRIDVITDATLEGVSGYIGNFMAQIRQKDQVSQVPAGVIVVATGFEPFDARKKPELGYGVYPEVITTVDFEHLISQEDQTFGLGAIRGDGFKPQKIVFIQCVGSRDPAAGNAYCSRVCCMVTAKQAHMVANRLPDADVTVFFMDVRAFGKGFEEFYDRVREGGVIYRRGNPSEIIRRGERVVVRAEDTLLGEAVEVEADLVVLAVGMVPCASTPALSGLLKLARSTDGFFMEAHPKLRPVDTAMAGVFLAGCCQGPKDVTETVVQARAAAAAGMIPLLNGHVQVDAATAFIDEEMCSGCGQCARICSFDALSLKTLFLGPALREGMPVSTAEVTTIQVMRVNPVLCQGCGACAATCPSGAINLHQFTFDQVMAQIDELTSPGTSRPATAVQHKHQGEHEKNWEPSYWILKTGGDVQGRVRSFLSALWRQAKLEGMVVPVYQAAGDLPGPKVLWGADELRDADPFVPLAQMKAAKLAEELAKERPSARVGAVLQSCELRALVERIKGGKTNLDHWLLVGVDCLASFPQEDFTWRAEKAGGSQELTQDVLRNARQGGISADRFRSACQNCSRPGAHGADVCIGVAGMPVKEYALLTARDEEMAQKLGFEQITDGRAPGWLVEQHERVLGTLVERHERMKVRARAELDDGLPEDVAAWMAHLRACGDCRACLDACPLYHDQLEVGTEAVSEWLTGCVACGVCEEACPQNLPLTAMVERIVEKLLSGETSVV